MPHLRACYFNSEVFWEGQARVPAAQQALLPVNALPLQRTGPSHGWELQLPYRT
jgi:hypothetical protein